MSARTIMISEEGSIVVIRGWRVSQLARQAGLKPTYSGAVQGWMLDAKRLPDLLGWLDYRNVRYELTRAQPTAEPAAPAPALEAGLW